MLHFKTRGSGITHLVSVLLLHSTLGFAFTHRAFLFMKICLNIGKDLGCFRLILHVKKREPSAFKCDAKGSFMSLMQERDPPLFCPNTGGLW